MNVPYFFGIKVGDKVESLEFGEGMLIHIITFPMEDEFELEIRFHSNREITHPYKYYVYNYHGRRERQDKQTLFYPGVKVTPPRKSLNE